MTARETKGKVSSRRPQRTKRRGAAIVEMAVITPLLILLLFGMIEFGWVFMVQSSLTNAAREACRVGVLEGASEADIRSRFLDAAGATGLDFTAEMITITEEVVGDYDVLTVQVVVPYSEVSLVGGYLGTTRTNIGSTCSMRKEG